MDKTSFKFDLNAKRIRITDDQVLSSVKEYAKSVNFRYFPTKEYDKWKEKIAHTGTIIERFGSWQERNCLRVLIRLARGVPFL